MTMQAPLGARSEAKPDTDRKRPKGARSEAKANEAGWSGLCPGRANKNWWSGLRPDRDHKEC